VSAAAGGHYVDKHRPRLLKIFRYFCTDYADAMAEAHVANPDADASGNHVAAERNRPLRGTPVFDRDKDSPTSASSGSAQHAQDREGSGEASMRSRFEKEHRAGRGGTSDAFETPNLKSGTAHLTKSVDDLTGPLTARRNAAAHVTRSVEGSASALSEGSAGGASPKSGKLAGKKGALQTPVNAGSLVGMEEGPGYMTFNDLMRMAEKMALYSPQLNLNKVMLKVSGYGFAKAETTLDSIADSAPIPLDHPESLATCVVF
jgi:hypothetical protein